jgi:hypothetical protein
MKDLAKLDWEPADRSEKVNTGTKLAAGHTLTLPHNVRSRLGTNVNIRG